MTSEWVMDFRVGEIPFAWHFNHMRQEDYLNIPANIYTGSGLNPDVRNTDFGLGFLFGKSMYGETVFPSLLKQDVKKEWINKFNKDFYLNVLQYIYLNRLKRLKVEGEGYNRIAFFSDNVKTSLKDTTVVHGDFLLRKENQIIFPLQWKKDKSLAVYSLQQDLNEIKLPDSWNNVETVSVFQVTGDGNKYIKNVPNKKNRITIKIRKETPYLLKPKNYKHEKINRS